MTDLCEWVVGLTLVAVGLVVGLRVGVTGRVVAVGLVVGRTVGATGRVGAVVGAVGLTVVTGRVNFMASIILCCNLYEVLVILSCAL